MASKAPKGKGKAKKKAEPLPLKPVDKIPAFSIYQRPQKDPNAVEQEKVKFMRRNKPIGEDLNKIKEIIRNLDKDAHLSVQEFIGLIGPSTGDKGELLRNVLAEEISNFRHTTRKVYETMTQDISDVLTNEHIQLTENSKERHSLYLERTQRNNNEIYTMCEDFDFDMFFSVSGYLDAKFPLAQEVDIHSEEIQALMRQEAYHRYHWLKSEGERLKEENTRLQKRLTYLKKQQKNELAAVAQREQQAEEERKRLEEAQEELQDKLDDLNESVGKTLVETEELTIVEATTTASDALTKPTKSKKKVVDRSTFRKPRPEWATQAAADIEAEATEHALVSETSKVSMRGLSSMSVTASATQSAKSKRSIGPQEKRKKRPKKEAFHYSPIKTPPRKEDAPRPASPFHFSPPRSPVREQSQRSPFHYSPPREERQSVREQSRRSPPPREETIQQPVREQSRRSPFHYSPPREAPMQPPPEQPPQQPPARVRVETTETVTERFGRRGRATAPRDTWGGF